MNLRRFVINQWHNITALNIIEMFKKMAEIYIHIFNNKIK